MWYFRYLLIMVFWHTGQAEVGSRGFVVLGRNGSEGFGLGRMALVFGIGFINKLFGGPDL